MNLKWFILFLFFIYTLCSSKITLAQNIWIIQNSGTQNNLYSIDFKYNNSVWAVGNDGTIIHSKNGGDNWNVQSNGFINTKLNSIHMISPDIGWIAGDKYSLLKTINGGNNWSKLDSSDLDYANYHSVFFTDTMHGWLGGHWGIMKYTIDGGNNWEFANDNDVHHLSVFFIDSLNGWAVGHRWSDYYLEEKGIILNTSNGGRDWWSVQLTGIDGWLRTIYFIDSLNGWTAGDNGRIMNTVDGGENWTEQNSGVTNTLNEIQFINNDYGWAVGNDGIILTTTDRGDNWNISESPTQNNLNSVCFLDTNNGIICGDSGIVLKYSNIIKQPAIMVEIKVNDGLSQDRNLRVGIDLEATDSVDYIFGEKVLAEMPSEGIFEVRLVLPKSKLNSYTDYRFGNPEEILTCVHEIKYQLGENSDGLLLSWELPEFAFINFIDPFEGVLFDTTFGSGKGKFKVSYLALTKLYAVITYNDTITSIENDYNKINNYYLFQNYPNPFNPVTTIKYRLPSEVKSEKSKVKNVTIKVFDILGREVATLVNEKQKPGNYEVEFDASTNSAKGSTLTSGIYFYRLQVGDFVETKKMILLR